MPRPASDTLTARESEVMMVLWERGPVTADVVRTSLPDDPHDSTVRTLLRVLEEKGYVRHTTTGKAYVYEAVVRRENAVRGAVRNLLKRFFDGSASALVQRLIEDEELSPEEIETLQREAQRAERENRRGSES